MMDRVNQRLRKRICFGAESELEDSATKVKFSKGEVVRKNVSKRPGICTNRTVSFSTTSWQSQ
jgi:hypothetical protein